jgi:transcription elongation factor GreA
MKKIYQKPPVYHFTSEGLEKLKQEQQQLLTERPDAIEHLKKAREMGDLSENGYYKASKSKVISIDARLRRLAHIIKYAQIISPTNQATTVQLGTTVTLSDGKSEVTYQLVGGFESNPSEGKISDNSPIGRALLHKKAGDSATITTPTQTTTYLILKIH